MIEASAEAATTAEAAAADTAAATVGRLKIKQRFCIFRLDS